MQSLVIYCNVCQSLCLFNWYQRFKYFLDCLCSAFATQHSSRNLTQPKNFSDNRKESSQNINNSNNNKKNISMLFHTKLKFQMSATKLMYSFRKMIFKKRLKYGTRLQKCYFSFLSLNSLLLCGLFLSVLKWIICLSKRCYSRHLTKPNNIKI